MAPLGLVVTCSCGARGRVQPGQTWTCPSCGTSWDTAAVPEEEYAFFLRRVRHAKATALAGLVVVVVVFAPLGLLVSHALWLTGLVLLAVWYFWYGPHHRKQVRKLYTSLPRWTVEPSDATTPTTRPPSSNR